MSLRTCSQCGEKKPASNAYFVPITKLQWGEGRANGAEFRRVCRTCENKSTQERHASLEASGLKRCQRCHRWLPATMEVYGSSPKRKNLRMLDQCRECRRYAADRHTERLEDAKRNAPAAEVEADLWVLPMLPEPDPVEQEVLAGAVCRGWGRQFQWLPAQKAKEVCASCPVINECRLLGDLVESVLPTGGRGRHSDGWPVWAGETLEERARRRKA